MLFGAKEVTISFPPGKAVGTIPCKCSNERRETLLFPKIKDYFGGYTPSGPVEYIVVGLGNPGKEYENTRHNAGYLAVDYISAKRGFRVDKLKFKSLCGDTMIAGKRVLFLKPTTFMNLSGEAVRDAMQFYKIPIERVIILYDDISLEPGHLRIRRKGSDGDHNGIKNIIYLTGKDTFPRIKMGVGAKPHPQYDLADWVLSKFSAEERKALESTFGHANDAVELIVDGKIDQAMNQFNS